FSALIGRTRGQRYALTDLRARQRPFLGLCFKKIWASVNYLTSGRKPYRQTQGDVKGMPMLAWIIGIVVAIGLIWSVAAGRTWSPWWPTRTRLRYRSLLSTSPLVQRQKFLRALAHVR